MSTVTFDTLKFVETLKSAGMDDRQAKAIATAYRDASFDQELVTGKDLLVALAPMDAKIDRLSWMVGLVVGGVVALIMKAFF